MKYTKCGFTLIETLIGMMVLFIIFAIFNISMLTAFRSAKISRDVGSVEDEIRLLDVKIYSIIGKDGCNITGCSLQDNTLKIDTHGVRTYEVHVGYPLELKECTYTPDSIEVEIMYKICGATETKILEYPLPNTTYCGR